jgi:hypothetical protein
LKRFAEKTLVPEGDIIRRLGYSNYVLKVDEDKSVDFVSSLRSDLRDGRVLSLLVESLTGESASTTKGALDLLQKKGLDLTFHGSTITETDILNGHKEKTLGLLFKLYAAWRLVLLLKKIRPLLELEIDALVLELRAKELHYQTSILDEMPQEIRFLEPQQENFDEQGALYLLIEWLWCVVALQSNFLLSADITLDLQDGSALAALLSYYHPTITNNTGNMSAFIESLETVGGLPILVTKEDLLDETFVDEKVLLILLAHLAKRFLQNAPQIRSTKLIQRFWLRIK